MAYTTDTMFERSTSADNLTTHEYTTTATPTSPSNNCQETCGGHYHNDTHWIPCKPNCMNCSNSNDCSECVSDYYLYGNDCKGAGTLAGTIVGCLLGLTVIVAAIVTGIYLHRRRNKNPVPQMALPSKHELENGPVSIFSTCANVVMAVWMASVLQACAKDTGLLSYEAKDARPTGAKMATVEFVS